MQHWAAAGLLYAVVLINSLAQAASTNCSCGYYNPETKDLFTDSTIVYFNETNGLPIQGWYVDQYSDPYEKGWNDQYREGASAPNVKLGNESNEYFWYGSTVMPLNASVLEMYIDAPTHNHLVVGSNFRTERKDMQFGSFRSLIRAPVEYSGGSALSVFLEYNYTQSIQMNVMNTAEPSTAWASTCIHNEFESRKNGLNFSQLNTSSMWDYTEYRIDWTADEVRFYVQGQLIRRVGKREDMPFPTVPTGLQFKHRSTGDFYTMQGPPTNTTVANVAWSRLFFNTTLMSKENHTAFDERCTIADACSIDDTTLRGSTPYPADATEVWKQVNPHQGWRWVPIALSSASAATIMLLVMNSLLRRVSWLQVSTFLKRCFGKEEPWGRRDPNQASQEKFGLQEDAPYSDTTREPHSDLSTQRNSTVPEGGIGIASAVASSASSTYSRDWYNHASKEGKGGEDPIVEIKSVLPTPANEKNIDAVMPVRSFSRPMSKSSSKGKEPEIDEKAVSPLMTPLPTDQEKKELTEKTAAAEPTPPPPTPKNANNIQSPKKRVDYLAGLVAYSSILVTGIHFCLTFVPAAVEAGTFAHYESENWARKTISSFLLNLIWIGPFLMTSTRFLVSSYLRTGDLKGVAEKAVGRTPRLIIPITCMTLLEYFVMDIGGTQWLMSLPSVTWSTWPFFVGFTNFGNFIDEVLQLAYLIPNAVPQITFNYCTGVLWTIPVQLQGSWQTLLSVIVIREITTPWKRFAYYTVCIVLNWYFLSWATYFYFGILLTDLDLTYKYRKWLHAHPAVYYPVLLFAFVLGFGGLSIDFATQWTNYYVSTYEYGIHPDTPTGLPIQKTGAAGYPQYYVPKLNGILFSVGFQALVELSPMVQRFFSFRVLVYVFPHIFTIYLIHGLVFWSLGAYLCVTLSALGIPYWANMLVTALSCYAVIGLGAPILTPVVELLGKKITQYIWQDASQPEVPRRPTLYPYTPDLFLEEYNRKRWYFF